MENSERLHHLDGLRGLACLAVCWYHLTHSTQGWLKASGQYGWLGVTVFFVLSGFVIPYSLYRSQYQLADYGQFILRRLLRLEPPYLVSVALAIAIPVVFALRPGFRGQWPSFGFWQIVAHLGYLNVFTPWPWVNGAYWTLAIEFQYYLLIGLSFPWLVSDDARKRWAMIGLLSAMSWLPVGWLAGANTANSWQSPDAYLLPYWLPAFLLGVMVFQCKVGLTHHRQALAVMPVLVTCLYYRQQNPQIVVAGAFATLALLRFPNWRALNNLGGLSYSLYLIHVPVGEKTFYLLNRLLSLPQAADCVIALTVCVLAAWTLHRAVEVPAQELAASYLNSKRLAPAQGYVYSA